MPIAGGFINTKTKYLIIPINNILILGIWSGNGGFLIGRPRSGSITGLALRIFSACLGVEAYSLFTDRILIILGRGSRLRFPAAKQTRSVVACCQLNLSLTIANLLMTLIKHGYMVYFSILIHALSETWYGTPTAPKDTPHQELFPMVGCTKNTVPKSLVESQRIPCESECQPS